MEKKNLILQMIGSQQAAEDRDLKICGKRGLHPFINSVILILTKCNYQLVNN